MKKKQSSNKPLGHFIKNSADRLAEAEKIHTMSPGDLYMFDFLKTESNILLRLAVKFWCKIHYASIRKLFNASNASNKGGAHVGNSADKH
jgi:hypothetical protein